MPQLIVRRPSSTVDMIRRYKILLDGVEIGTIKNNDELRYEIEPGPHVIQAKIDWCGSRAVEFECRSDEQLVTVRNSTNVLSRILILFYITVYWNGYLKIEAHGQDTL